MAAFAAATGLPIPEASAQWAGFSVQLSDAERNAVEAGGAELGDLAGRGFNNYVAIGKGEA